MDAIDAGGLWWLPDAPDVRVPGVLKVDEGGRARVELIGCFRDMFAMADVQENSDGSTVQSLSTDAFGKSGDYGRVCGQVGSKEYTLDDCHRGRMTSGMFGSAIASEEIRAGRVYRGIWLDKQDEAEFDQADVRLQWLPFWLMESAIGEQWTIEDAGTSEIHNMQINVTGLAARSCRPWTGWTVSLNHVAGVTGDRVTGRSVSQDYYFSIRTTSLTHVDRLLEVAADLQTLVSFGVNRPVGIEGLSLRHPRAHPPRRPQRKFRYPIDFVVPWSYRDTSDKTQVSDYDMAFTFPQIGGMAGVRKFLLAAAKYRESLTRVIASSMSTEMFVSDQLLHRAASLESFDRTRTNTAKSKIDFKVRLVRSAQFAGAPFSALVTDITKWASRVTQERNDAAHTLGLGSDAAEQYFVARSLYWLYAICLLREAGMPDPVFDHIGRNPELTFVRERLASMGF